MRNSPNIGEKAVALKKSMPIRKFKVDLKRYLKSEKSSHKKKTEKDQAVSTSLVF